MLRTHKTQELLQAFLAVCGVNRQETLLHHHLHHHLHPHITYFDIVEANYSLSNPGHNVLTESKGLVYIASDTHGLAGYPSLRRKTTRYSALFQTSAQHVALP